MPDHHSKSIMRLARQLSNWTTRLLHPKRQNPRRISRTYAVFLVQRGLVSA